MAARDMYIMQIIREHKLNNDNLEEVYEIVCNHFNEVETTKITLERMIWQKKYDEAVKTQLEIIKDELKDYLNEEGQEDPGFGNLFK